LVDRRPARVGGGVGGGGGGSSGGAYVPTGEKARENEGEKSIHLMLGTLRSFAIGDGGEIRSVCRRSRYHARCENGSNLFVGFCPYMNNCACILMRRSSKLGFEVLAFAYIASWSGNFFRKLLRYVRMHNVEKLMCIFGSF